MNTQKWEVLYARRGPKRSKFLDGVAIVRSSLQGLTRKVILYDQNNNVVEERFLKSSEVFEEGTDLDLDSHRVQVQLLVSGSGVKSPVKADVDKPPATVSSKEAKRPASAEQRLSPSFSFKKRKLPCFDERANVRQKPEPQQVVEVSSGSNDTCRRAGTSFAMPASSHRGAPSSCPQSDKQVVEPVIKFSPGTAQVQRQVVIPDAFEDLTSYKRVMLAAVLEEININLSELAKRFRTAREGIVRVSMERPSCRHGPAELRFVVKERSNAGRPYYTCVAETKSCLFSWADGQTDTQESRFLPFEEIEKALKAQNVQIVRISNITKRPGSILMKLSQDCKHSMGDLWILSSDTSFKNAIVGTGVSYGSSFVELRLLGSGNAIGDMKCALHGPNVVSEVQMLECLRKLVTPLAPLLLQRGQFPRDVDWSSTKAYSSAQAAIRKYKLNDDQAQVLLAVGQWFAFENAQTTPDICLVHGPFGSGKSYLLVVLIVFLSELLKERKDFKTRFVVSAATNIAVDRVLTGLLDQKFYDFIRVGSLRKIATNILPYSVHASGGGEAEAERDLRELLKDAVGNERLKIEKELKTLRDGRVFQRKEKLKQVRVVGVTCCSAGSKVLDGSTFKICFLDECSQMTEPLSLLPLCQFHCDKLVAVGDPQQLPPVLAGSTSNAESRNLSRTLFVRLAALGHTPILLRTQYRCHPSLALLPNRLFYKGRLDNGCSESDRFPLLQGLSPLVFVDTRKQVRESKDSNMSYSNSFEAEMVCLLIRTFLCNGISGSQIGVIVHYRFQESLIRQMLFPGNEDGMRKKTNTHELVQVSTVDAFQGSEKDIIVLSCCRTDGVGFTASPNRLNVAMTRARNHLIIIGDASNLQSSELWKELLVHARSTPNCFKTVQDIRTYIETLKGEIVDAGTEATEHKAGKFTAKASPCLSMNTVDLVDLAFEDELSCRLMKFLETVDFRPRDFWEGYKLYCIGSFSRSKDHQSAFTVTSMGRAIREIHGDLQWGPRLDRNVRSCWYVMEQYVKQRHGVDCGNIRFLIQEYDDPDKLAESEYGRMLLYICQDDDSEKCETKRSSIAMPDTTSVDALEGKLSDIGSRITKLIRRQSNCDTARVVDDDWISDLMHEDWTT